MGCIVYISRQGLSSKTGPWASPPVNEGRESPAGTCFHSTLPVFSTTPERTVDPPAAPDETAPHRV